MLNHRAEAYRRNHPTPLVGGVVVFYDGKICGWMNRLRDPESWRPGCIAADSNGDHWIARGGNEYDGAEEWVQLNEHE